MTLSIQEAKARHEARLLALPGVVSVGIGRDASGRPVIVVGVEEHDPKHVPELPAALEGHPVEVRATGPVRAR